MGSPGSGTLGSAYTVTMQNLLLSINLCLVATGCCSDAASKIPEESEVTVGELKGLLGLRKREDVQEEVRQRVEKEVRKQVEELGRSQRDFTSAPDVENIIRFTTSSTKDTVDPSKNIILFTPTLSPESLGTSTPPSFPTQDPPSTTSSPPLSTLPPFSNTIPDDKITDEFSKTTPSPRSSISSPSPRFSLTDLATGSPKLLELALGHGSPELLSVLQDANPDNLRVFLTFAADSQSDLSS